MLLHCCSESTVQSGLEHACRIRGSHCPSSYESRCSRVDCCYQLAQLQFWALSLSACCVYPSKTSTWRSTTTPWLSTSPSPFCRKICSLVVGAAKEASVHPQGWDRLRNLSPLDPKQGLPGVLFFPRVRTPCGRSAQVIIEGKGNTLRWWERNTSKPPNQTPTNPKTTKQTGRPEARTPTIK